MSNIKHKYADILIAIANGDNIQIQDYDNREQWDDVNHQRVLSHIYQDNGTSGVRVKPKTININGFEVPEPMKVKPNHLTRCYYPVLYFDDICEYVNFMDDDLFCNGMLYNGMLHSTSEAAKLHAEALLSFTKGKA